MRKFEITVGWCLALLGLTAPLVAPTGFILTLVAVLFAPWFIVGFPADRDGG